jgi:hypothetical protein
MKEFTQDGMFNELSKVTRAINRKKYESMDLPRYNLGGSSCPDGLEWDETLQQCVNITNLNEVSVTPVSRHVATYEETNPFQDFFAKKKADYIRKAGNFGKLTDLESNFPEAQLKKIRDEYEYLRNNYVAKKLGHNYNDREKWVDKLSASEREVLQNSEFASKLRPSLWAKTKAGLIGLGNTMLPGQPLAYDVKGLSPKEEAEYKKNKLAALDATSFADLPGAVISNALSNSREYASNPGIFSGEIVNDAGELGAGLLNPLLPLEIGTGVSLAPDLIELSLKGAQGAFKAGKKLSRGLTDVPLELPGSPNQEELVDLWRIQEREARPMSELAAEGKLGKHFQNEKAIKHFKDREEHFGQWFTKDKNDFDFYNADREFIDPEIINLKVPASKLESYSQYNKSLSRAPEREFVVPFEEQSLYRQSDDMSDGANSLGTISSEAIRPLRSEYKPELTNRVANNLEALLQERRSLFNTPEGESRIQSLIDNTPELKEAGFTVEDYKKGLNNIQNVNAYYNNLYDDFENLDQAIQYGQTVPGADFKALQDMNSQLGKMSEKLAEYEEFIDRPNRFLNALVARSPKDMPASATKPQGLNLVKESIKPDDFHKIFASPYLNEEDILRIGRHEIGHYIQRGVKTNLDHELSKITLLNDNPDFKNVPFDDTPGGSNFYKSLMSSDNPFKNAKDYWKTGSKGKEKLPFVEEVRADLLEKGIIDNLYDEVTPEMLEYHQSLYNQMKGNKYPLRIYDIMEKTPENYNIMSSVINKMPVAIPAMLGVGAAAKMSNEESPLPNNQRYGGNISNLQKFLR